MLGQFLQAEIFAVFLVFTRLGATIMIMPGFGEIYVPRNIRLALAVAITLAVAPVVAPLMPAQPADPLTLFMIVTGEIVIGLMIGSIARLTMSALHVSGTVIAFQSSLAFALTMDPTQGIQGALIASLFSLMGVVLIFSTGRGTPLGFPIAPVIKVASTDRLYHRMEDDMDINAGIVLEGGTLDDVGNSIMDLIERVISGELTKAEINKQNGILALYTQTTSF